MADEPELRAKSEEKEFSPEASIEKTQDQSEFPEGGARAWGVALGCAGILFCTFGVNNSFGYDKRDLEEAWSRTNEAPVFFKNTINPTNYAPRPLMLLPGLDLYRSSSC